ncbi:MAG TPA: hypothetical protein VLL25_18550 [Acidimicrobiales bacterium]|nr:hypothetical protein [Acidimicrobiales bacterium]
MSPNADTEGHFVDDRHALYVGWIVGIALRNGVVVEPVIDEAGNYTDRLTVALFGSGPTVTLIVPPPPADWSPPDAT